MKNAFFVVALSGLAVACASAPGVSRDVKDRIAECGAGYDSQVKLTANLEAKVDENIRSPSASADLGVKDDLYAAFTKALAPKVSEDNAVKLYDLYLNCLNDIRA